MSETYGFDPLLKVLQPDGVYIPLHMVDYGSGRSGHCCFAGCTPMGCPGRCCVQEMGHRADCPSNPFREFDEYEHECYVNAGMRKHLATTPPSTPRRCVSCGDYIGYNFGYDNGSCGPSGCLNRPT